MSKSKWAPDYYKKKEIIVLENHDLVNAFEQAVTNVMIMINCRSKVSQMAYKNLDWIRDELLQRLK